MFCFTPEAQTEINLVERIEMHTKTQLDINERGHKQKDKFFSSLDILLKC